MTDHLDIQRTFAGPVLWHHRVHEHWANERLYFWRLAFNPECNKDAISKKLIAVFRHHNVLSYALYELAGLHDFFIRLWMPPTVSSDRFMETIRTTLEGDGLKVCEPYEVHRPILHWVFADEQQRLLEPDGSVLANPLADEDIARINSCSAAQEQIEEWTKQSILAAWTPIDGIRFILVIPRPERSLTLQLEADLVEKLRTIVVSIEAIRAPSLYVGHGFGQFVLLATVRYEDYFSIAEQLIARIYELQRGYGVRTYTHFVLPRPSTRPPVEHLPVAGRGRVSTLDEQLAGYEGQTLEVKGSAFVDVKRLIISGDAVENFEAITKDGVLRAIVGMLNSEGGDLIIGALEPDRFERLADSERFLSFPRIGRYSLCGINVDYAGRRDWDWFERRLISLLKDWIKPSAQVWVRLRRHEKAGRELCVATVTRPSGDWFYLKEDPTFYVRSGGSTRPLYGPEADVFKKANPR